MFFKLVSQTTLCDVSKFQTQSIKVLQRAVSSSELRVRPTASQSQPVFLHPSFLLPAPITYVASMKLFYTSRFVRRGGRAGRKEPLANMNAACLELAPAFFRPAVHPATADDAAPSHMHLLYTIFSGSAAAVWRNCPCEWSCRSTAA